MRAHLPTPTSANDNRSDGMVSLPVVGRVCARTGRITRHPTAGLDDLYAAGLWVLLTDREVEAG